MQKPNKLNPTPILQTNNIKIFSITTLIWFNLTITTLIYTQLSSEQQFSKLFWICTTATTLGIIGTSYLKFFKKPQNQTHQPTPDHTD